MITEFAQEKIHDIYVEVAALLQAHYEELMNTSLVKLKPIWKKYLQMEADGEFVVFTVRVDGELVGYSGFFIEPHIHYADTIVARNDVLFLKKEHRKGTTTGIRLIKYSDERCKELGANKITWHVKPAYDFRPILHRIGYLDEETVVGKFYKEQIG